MLTASSRDRSSYASIGSWLGINAGIGAPVAMSLAHWLIGIALLVVAFIGVALMRLSPRQKLGFLALAFFASLVNGGSYAFLGKESSIHYGLTVLMLLSQMALGLWIALSIFKERQ